MRKMFVVCAALAVIFAVQALFAQEEPPPPPEPAAAPLCDGNAAVIVKLNSEAEIPPGGVGAVVSAPRRVEITADGPITVIGEPCGDPDAVFGADTRSISVKRKVHGTLWIINREPVAVLVSVTGRAR